MPLVQGTPSKSQPNYLP